MCVKIYDHLRHYTQTTKNTKYHLLSLRATCPLAFAEALAQAGQGLARLLESYGEQAGASVAIFGIAEPVPKRKRGISLLATTEEEKQSCPHLKRETV